MANILGDYPFVRVYIDDITIVSRNMKEHLAHIELVLSRLRLANLKLNPEKCTWFSEEIKILGHVVNENGIFMDPEKIEAIKTRPAPVTVKQLQSFLGLTNYYRRFVRGYSTIAAPLHAMISKSNKWAWSAESQQAFELLKEALISYPILRLPDFERPFILHTDASHIALGAILAQIDADGREYVTQYASKLLKNEERNYGISELECLAIIWAIHLFRVYLYSQKFTIFTDNNALKWLITLNDPSARLSRWSILLQHFEFEVKHRKGVEHCNVDALSRPVHINVLINRDQTTEHSSKLFDPYEDSALLHYLETRKHIPGLSKKQTRRIEKSFLFYHLKNDKIMCRKSIEDDFTIEIPRPEMRAEIIKKEHELSHFKPQHIYDNLINKMYFWKNMMRDITEICGVCEVCLKYDKQKLVNAPANALHIDSIFDRWGIDIVGGLPETKEGYRSI